MQQKWYYSSSHNSFYNSDWNLRFMKMVCQLNITVYLTNVQSKPLSPAYSAGSVQSWLAYTSFFIWGVGIAVNIVSYRLDNLGVWIPAGGRGHFFSKMSGTHLASSSMDTGFLSPWVKQQGNWAGYSPPYGDKVQSDWSCTCTLHIYIHGVDRNNSTSFYIYWFILFTSRECWRSRAEQYQDQFSDTSQTWHLIYATFLLTNSKT